MIDPSVGNEVQDEGDEPPQQREVESERRDPQAQQHARRGADGRLDRQVALHLAHHLLELPELHVLAERLAQLGAEAGRLDQDERDGQQDQERVGGERGYRPQGAAQEVEDAAERHELQRVPVLDRQSEIAAQRQAGIEQRLQPRLVAGRGGPEIVDRAPHHQRQHADGGDGQQHRAEHGQWPRHAPALQLADERHADDRQEHRDEKRQHERCGRAQAGDDDDEAGGGHEELQAGAGESAASFAHDSLSNSVRAKRDSSSIHCSLVPRTRPGRPISDNVLRLVLVGALGPDPLALVDARYSIRPRGCRRADRRG